MAGKEIEFRNGIPYPVYREPFTNEAVKTAVLNSLSLQYNPLTLPGTDDILPGEDRFIGATKLEVIMHRVSDRAAHGDMEAVNFIYDRILGKPKQQTENINVAVNYQQFIKELAAQPPKPEGAITVEVREVNGVQIAERATVSSAPPPLQKPTAKSFLSALASGDDDDDLMDGI